MSLRKDRCTRRSPVTSGWKAVASRWLPRTATTRGVAVPGGVTSAKTSTPGPTSSTHGARMNTARSRPPDTPANRRSVSKDSTCGPERVAAGGDVQASEALFLA